MSTPEFCSITRRQSKVGLSNLAPQALPLYGFVERLPKVLAADTLRRVVACHTYARSHDKPVIWSMGGHVVKCGLGPVIKTLLEQGVITHLAVNGSVIVHDVELALFGHTSEDVEATLGSGEFGMTAETQAFIRDAIVLAHKKGRGLGETIGFRLVSQYAPHVEHSIFAGALLNAVPITVHPALGTDVWQMNPDLDWGMIGDAAQRDFQSYCEAVGKLGMGGVHCNWGCAVIMPEVALKAFSLNLNQGICLSGATFCNFDMLQHYRPRMSFVERPKRFGSEGHHITGHHEILLPIVAGLVMAEVEAARSQHIG